MEPLRVSLETYGSDNVRAIARRLGLPEVEAGVSKAQLVDRLVQEIPKRVKRRGVAPLSEAARGVLALLLERGGMAAPADLLEPLLLSGRVRLNTAPDLNAGQPRFDEVLHALLLQGTIVNLTPPSGSSRRRDFTPLEEIAIPPEVIQVLPQEKLSPPHPEPERFSCAAPTHEVREDPQQFLRHLLFFWGELWREPGRALKSGGLYKRDLRRVVQSLGETLETVDEESMRDIVTLLFELGLLVEIEGEIFAVDELTFWRQETTVILRKVLEKIPFIAPRLTLPEVSAGDLYGYGDLQFWSLDHLYERVFDLLKTLAGAGWFSFSLFLALLNRDRVGAFLVPASNLGVLYRHISWYSWSGESLESRRERLEQHLRRAERSILQQMLEYLKTHGIVSLGYEEDSEGVTALRLTPLARAALGGEPYVSESTSEGQIVLQPDFQLLAMGPVSLETLVNLERLATREDVQPSTVTYRLTKDSVYQALQSGETVQGLLDFLDAHSLMPLPQNVVRSIREWGAQHERIVVRRDVLVLQVDTPERLEQLVQAEGLTDIVHPLSERTAWVHSQDADRLERHLWALDYLPMVSRSSQDDLPASLTWDEERGELSPRASLPSLYVTGTLRRFAERKDGAWTLSPASIQAAVSAGLSIPEVLERLGTMVGEPLSAKWEQRLKAWGGHYGDARTARVRLIRLESAKALQELRKTDTRFRRWLTPLDGEQSAIAVVDDTHWEELVERLQAWGIDVTEKSWW